MAQWQVQLKNLTSLNRPYVWRGLLHDGKQQGQVLGVFCFRALWYFLGGEHCRETQNNDGSIMRMEIFDRLLPPGMAVSQTMLNRAP